MQEQPQTPTSTPAASTAWSSTATAHAVSPDSGLHWSAEGAWPVADGITRIPLPLPEDGLRAVNVYVIETEEGLTLVDGGWAIQEARELLERCLRDIGHTFADIRRFLVTHVHRDHYTLAAVLGHEHGAEVVLGLGEKPALDLLNDASAQAADPFVPMLLAAGATDLARNRAPGRIDPADWQYPHTWIEGDRTFDVGTRRLDAVHTPGHTPGHYVFAEQGEGLLFAGDHVLPTITPSIGFTLPPEPDPLGSFMASLTRVRSLPDLRLLPAHGPLAPSSHARVDELLAFHEGRLAATLTALAASASSAQDVARQLPWTRHDRSYSELDPFNQMMATLETQAHLDLLVARHQVFVDLSDEGIRVFTASP